MAGYEGLPEDLSALSDDELSALEEAAVAAFDEIAESDDVTPESLAAADQIANDIDALRAEASRRQEMALENAARREELRGRVHGTQPSGPEVEASAETTQTFASEEDTEEPDPEGESVTENTQDIPEKAVTAAAPEHYSPAQTTPREAVAKRKLNLSLSGIQSRAPQVTTPRNSSEAVLVATADIPGLAQGARLENMAGLVQAMQSRVKTVGITARGDDAPRYSVATLNRQFKHLVDREASPQQISDVLTAASDPQALVAAGGWCSPSEISYDLFNVVCEDGMLDLPTVGVNRGGIRFPISPDFSSLSGNPAMWSWTETQDIAAVTGTAQSGTKTCGRVPCATFSEERLECNGVCLTVGNLMDDAYPELIENHTRLLFAFNAHQMNLRRINKLVAASVAVSGFTGMGATGDSVVNNVLGALAIQATDYRAKFAMCQDAPLEVVLPFWILDMMRSDLRRRTGIELISVADSYLMDLFNALNIRVQFVGDWQMRTTGFPGAAAGLLAWPTQVQALMFAPGTFVLGQGLQLNLGVIRDSVLNATNDFTAAWMEECWLIAKLGHESRLITINVCANGRTGANDLTACGV
jgi:hypothetical protein